MLKGIHQSLYNNIKFKEGEFVEIGSLEEFQYAILSIDYILIILTSMLILRYMSVFIGLATKTEMILNSFLTKWFIFLSLLILFYT